MRVLNAGPKPERTTYCTDSMLNELVEAATEYALQNGATIEEIDNVEFADYDEGVVEFTTFGPGRDITVEFTS